MAAATLRDVLTGGVVATGKDDMFPTLTGVRFSWADGGAVEIAATDRYRLVVGVTTTTGQNDGEFLLYRKHALEIAKALPKPARGMRDADITVSVVDKYVVFRIDTTEGSLTREYRTLDGEFPRYRSLIPSDDVLTGDVADGFSCNPAYMADVAKLPHERNTPVSWRFQNSLRPAVATYPEHNGVSWTYLLMPVRIPA
jgi:DNA polymerase III sliding clamp (beta) subunit (PCNA family)